MHTLEPGTKVSVIGMGEMGSALARAFLAAGCDVTVWNRSPHKCEPLGRAGAKVADTLEQALEAAPAIVTCVANYAVLAATLHVPAMAQRLVGKTLVQFSSRTPAEARLGGAWAAQWGIRCLEGAIFAYPPAVGTPEGTVVLSGASDVFAAMAPLLQALGDSVLHAGEDIGSAPALELGVVGTFVPGAVVAFLQGVALSVAEGASPEVFLSLLERHAFPKLALAMMKIGTPMIQSGDYTYRGEGAPLGVWLGGLELACVATEEAGVKASFIRAVTAHLQDAVAAGHGDDEMPAIYELLKQH